MGRLTKLVLHARLHRVLPNTAEEMLFLTLHSFCFSLGWYHGERLCDGTQGWFPANHTEEIVNEHVRARNLRQRYRLLAASKHLIGGTLRL